MNDPFIFIFIIIPDTILVIACIISYVKFSKEEKEAGEKHVK